jgi:hypothetical protein
VEWGDGGGVVLCCGIRKYFAVPSTIPQTTIYTLHIQHKIHYFFAQFAIDLMFFCARAQFFC